ncbi:MAG: hypothetical protein QXK37_04585 [Candidatus Woesearchaeota archaeon]
MHKRKRKKKLSITLLIIGFIVVSVLSTVWFYYGFVLLEVKRIPMDFKVGRSVGINADTDVLHFGKTLPGGGSMRKILVTNPRNFDVEIKIVNTGNFSQWINISERRFSLGPGCNKTIYYDLTVPENALEGVYNGTSHIYIKRKLFS